MIPPLHDGNFVAHMEMVLDTCKQPYDPLYPVVCMDESPRQLIAETRIPVPARPGQLARYDYEYSRKGMCTICIANEPLVGKRMVRVTSSRKKDDWVRQIILKSQGKSYGLDFCNTALRQIGNGAILDLAVFAIGLSKQVAMAGFSVEGGLAGIEIT